MNPRLAAVAFAASVVIAAPAAADPVRGALLKLEKELSHDTSLVIQVGHNNHRAHRNDRYGPRVNEFGQTRWEVRQLRREAVRMCVRATRRQAYDIGFRDVDFDDDPRARQIGPRGFRVRMHDVEFENRRRDIERDVICTVRRGRVVRLDGVPDMRRRGYRDTGYRNSGHRY